MAVLETKKIFQITKAALDAVFPEFCIRCEKEGELLCGQCRLQIQTKVLHERCPFCERITSTGSVCRRCTRFESLDGAVALAQYAELGVRRLLRNWKYASDVRCGSEIEKLIRRVLVNNYLPDLPWVIVPASLHRARARQRGFDQAHELADIIAKQTEWPIMDCLVRSKRTVPQARAGQNRAQVGQLRGIYRVTGQAPEYVLLIDDVLTTGATLDAAAHELKQAGSECVWALTMARGT